jgi:uncharacterized membrane protein
MTEDAPKPRHFHAHFQKNLIAGLLAITPLVVVWVVFDFLLSLLSEAGQPLAVGMTEFVDSRFPQAAPWLADERVRAAIAVIIALLVLYTIGAVTSQIIGARIIDYFERLITRIPFVETIYSATKKLVTVLQQKPDGTARVVLIEFPHPGMHAIGMVMRVMKDAASGEDVAAVYVPTTPNPTSGYLEIVPVRSLIPTEMTMDQAMTMIISGGAISPATLTTSRPAPAGIPVAAA